MYTLKVIMVITIIQCRETLHPPRSLLQSCTHPTRGERIKSQSCQKWRNVLKERNYRIGHLHLTPTQVAIPNDRPRYYCIAILRRRPPNSITPRSADDNGVDNWHLASSSRYEDETLDSWFASKEDNDDGDDAHHPLAVSRNIHTSIDPLGVVERDAEDERNRNGTDCTTNDRNSCKSISYFLDSTDTICANSNDKEDPHNNTTITNGRDSDNGGTGTSLFVPQKVLKSNASWCFDIVTPSVTSTSHCAGGDLWNHDRGDDCGDCGQANQLGQRQDEFKASDSDVPE